MKINQELRQAGVILSLALSTLWIAMSLGIITANLTVLVVLMAIFPRAYAERNWMKKASTLLKYKAMIQTNCGAMNWASNPPSLVTGSR